MTEPKTILRSDYRSPDYTIDQTKLDFDLRDGLTKVRSELHIRQLRESASVLRLHGQNLVLDSVTVDGRELAHNEYQVDDFSLSLFDLPANSVVSIQTQIVPEENTALEGLYRSGSMYCTQCEAEGFRKITYYLDQPDVLSTYTTRIEADAQSYPVLLSNGNKIAEELLDNGRRTVIWEDPFPKPSYLFALVAGDLALLEDTFVTCSGREIKLEIYSEPHNITQCDYAMDALKRSMRWDEEVYGREYDLDIFMIVAVEDFNMGAMENKGLNIFNTSCVLASPDTATDAAYQRVEAVVAHEYFHNWSGNRVTCRDWFQLSLKEGFTVYRDAQFSADMNAATVKRIEDVSFLRSVQFAEDAGPMAHPIRPDSYIEINNFYTVTVYEKGAEIVGMLHRLLGDEGFRKGSDLYFERHDGQAVTTEDFVIAMEDANAVQLTEFRHWYAQAGTPGLSVLVKSTNTGLRIEFSQSTKPTPGQLSKTPFHIPIAMGLLSAQGEELQSSGATTEGAVQVSDTDNGLLVELKGDSGAVDFVDVPGDAVVSLLRGFSAPVRLSSNRTAADLLVLARNDSDGFSRWDAMQTLFADEIERLASSSATPDRAITTLVGELLQQAQAVPAGDDGEQRALLNCMLKLPTVATLFDRATPIDVHALLDAREQLSRHIGTTFQAEFHGLFEQLQVTQPYSPSPAEVARRSLQHCALSYLAQGGDDIEGSDLPELLERFYQSADNLSDRRAVLVTLLENRWLSADQRAKTLADFYDRWQSEALVVDVWFGLQAANLSLAEVLALESHSAFEAKNPNKLRALYGSFGGANYRVFHAEDGSGYDFLAKRIISLNSVNPSVAARLLTPLTQWQRYGEQRQAQLRGALEQIAAVDNLSTNVYEIVSNSLAVG